MLQTRTQRTVPRDVASMIRLPIFIPSPCGRSMLVGCLRRPTTDCSPTGLSQADGVRHYRVPSHSRSDSRATRYHLLPGFHSSYRHGVFCKTDEYCSERGMLVMPSARHNRKAPRTAPQAHHCIANPRQTSGLGAGIRRLTGGHASRPLSNV